MYKKNCVKLGDAFRGERNQKESGERITTSGQELRRPTKRKEILWAAGLVVLLGFTTSVPSAFAVDYAGWKDLHQMDGGESIMKPNKEASQTNSLINSHVSTDEPNGQWMQVGWYDSSLYAGDECYQTSGAMIRYIEFNDVVQKYCKQQGSVDVGQEFTYRVERGASCADNKYWWYGTINGAGWQACLLLQNSVTFAQLESFDLSNTAESKFRELKYKSVPSGSWSYWDGYYALHCTAPNYFITVKTSNTQFTAKDGSGSCQ